MSQKRIIVLGNAPSLKYTFLPKLQTFENDIIIACNYFYKSSKLPTYYCLTDTNFFNHCPIPPERFFGFKTTFVLTYHLARMYHDILETLKTKFIPLEISEEKLLETGKLTFPKVAMTHGTLTTLALPLAYEMICQNPQLAREIVVYGVDNVNEKLHFYPEDSLAFEIINKTRQELGCEPYSDEAWRKGLNHPEETKRNIKQEWDIIAKFLYDNEIHLYRCFS